MGYGKGTKAEPTTAPRERQRPTARLSEDDVIWGAVRRQGSADLLDPRAYRGVTRHAYLPGVERLAICGFIPKRPRWMHHGPLLAAVNGDLSAPCRRCLGHVRSVPTATTSRAVDGFGLRVAAAA